MPIKDYSTTAGTNTSIAGINIAEGCPAANINNAIRSEMADTRSFYESATWTDLGHTPTRTGNTTFTIPGDVTSFYVADRRIRCTDSSTLYGTIASSSYGAPNTTVTVTLDSGSLSVSLTAVAVSLIDPTGDPIPFAAIAGVPSTDLPDNTFRVVGSTDATKKVALEVDGLTTGTTRTLTVQDVSGTVYVTGGTDVAIADGGTGASTVSAAQASFGIFQNSQVFSSSGTFTPATNVTRVYVEVWGAGGGGGGATSSGASGGGGSGGYSAGYITVTPSVGCTVTVGTGGGGGNTSGTNGSAGGNSSFSNGVTTITANGGSGGTGATGLSATPNAGGAGGSSSNGTLNLTGQAGQVGFANSGTPATAGSGGSAPRGGLGGQGPTLINTGNALQAGPAGSTPGGGGSGSIGVTTAYAGGAGADGMVIVYYP